MTLRLVVVEGEGRGAQLKLRRKPIFEVGSAAAVDLRLDDPEVAGVHLKCYREGEGYQCLDVSGHGFVQDGRTVTKATLGVGDSLRIGRHALQLLSDDRLDDGPREAAGEPEDGTAGADGSTSLVALRGNDRGRRFALEGRPVYILGRGVSTDITLWDIRASRAHCRIDRQDGGVYVVSDLNSSNGTYVNGDRLRSRHRLQVGDTIRIGSTVLRFAASTRTP